MTEDGQTADVRATLRLRNDAIVSARERLGLTQKEAAELSEVPVYTLCAFERFEYYGREGTLRQKAERIAGALEIPVDKVMPPGMLGKAIRARFVERLRLPYDRLLEAGAVVSQSSRRLALPAPQRMDDEYLSGLRDALEDVMCKLSLRERGVLRLRFGLKDGKRYTLEEVGRIFRSSRERIRQIEAKAIREMRQRGKGKAIEDYVEVRT